MTDSGIAIIILGMATLLFVVLTVYFYKKYVNMMYDKDFYELYCLRLQTFGIDSNPFVIRRDGTRKQVIAVSHMDHDTTRTDRRSA